MATALILLIGEQPIPNLLPTRHLEPDVVALVHTDHTKDVAKRLENLLSRDYRCRLCSVDPYDLPATQLALRDFLDRELVGYELLFNLTGGTKPMSLAAFLTASQRSAPFVYFQTEGGRSLLYHYQFTDQREVQLAKTEEILGTITLDDYLRAQVERYTSGPPRDEFERQIYDTLQSIAGLEILTSVRPQGREALEVDFIVRLGNQVGVIEAQTRGAKSGIDRVQAATEQRYLGTYVAKFLVSGDTVDGNNKNLAQAYQIEVIELLSYKSTGSLSEGDQHELRQRILNKLGKGS